MSEQGSNPLSTVMVALRANPRELAILDAWRDRTRDEYSQPSRSDALRAAIKALAIVERDRDRKRTKGSKQ